MTTAQFQRFAKRLLWLYLPTLVLLVFVLLPFYWMVITSLKQDRNIFDPKANPFWFSMAPTLKHYTDLINPNKTDFLIWIQNSLMVAVLVTLISVSIGILAGYSLARLRYKGAQTIGSSVFITYLVPPSLLFLPLSHVIGQLGLTETRWAMVISYPTFLVPFCTWLLMGYFRTIPKEIEECALVDGCTRLKALIRIVLPVAIPGIITAALFSFTLAWGEYLYSITFVTDSYEKTIPSAVVGELIRGDVYHWGGLMAGALLGSVPIALIYVIFLDYYVSGLTAGATKG
ncbi:MAG: carbohydrate ABC transporter permease [Candidatus Tectomicrobia bacterium]|uniref:Carbohydrate ABC transporter permease n=1 Tax=Tectimicrobiota bacterium TaxID=2528274 RepID=A0A938B631_UNCTE|nr:carbohydrate ABC transporter permease [Candidatus Tectomicrobia bacterium]